MKTTTHRPLLDPLISIVMPVYRTDPKLLTRTIASVQAQLYRNWQLCVVDDGSNRPLLDELLTNAARKDARISYQREAVNQGIVATTNVALSMATGEFVAFLDHDDLLERDALQAVVEELRRFPDTDLVYTDEDKIEGRRRCDPFHKPAWSPDYLLGCMYLAHLCVYRRQIVEEVGGIRDGTDGAQDWDLALRVTERTSAVRHIPRVLYHWRKTANSTASTALAKPEAILNGRVVLTDYLARNGVEGRVERTPELTMYRVRKDVRGKPLVSILLPTAGTRRVVREREVELVVGCVRSVLTSTTWEHFEIVCLVGEDFDPRLRTRLAKMAGDTIRFVEVPGPFNFSRTINAGAVAAKGDYILLLNDDIEVIESEWLTMMLELGQDKGVGVVGATLLYEDGRLQHAGVVHRSGTPGHVYYGAPDNMGYFSELALNRNYSAVTGAVQLSRAEVFWEVGGLSEEFPLNFNDIDYCLKVFSRGYRNVVSAGARLYHFESSTRSTEVFQGEIDLFLERWAAWTLPDPVFSPRR